MSFAGKLEHFRLTDLLQMLAITAKTGKLNLTQRDGQGMVVFRRGKIIFAASSSYKETLGSLLVSRGLITQEQLEQALDVHQQEPARRLGNALVEMGAVSQTDLEGAMTEQVERVLSEFLQWDSGYFQFEPLEILEEGEVEIDTGSLLLSEGVSPEGVLLRLASQLDSEAAGKLPPRSGGGPETAPPTRLASLRSIMREIRSPEFTAEVTVRILEYAARFVQRGVLFVVRREDFTGMGQFGVELAEGDANDKVRQLRLPLDEPTVLSEAAARQDTFRGRVGGREWDDYLLERLGGGGPREAIAIPIMVSDRVLLIFYGDNHPTEEPIGPVEELELLMMQAGLAMERNLLESRIRHYEKLRDLRGSDEKLKTSGELPDLPA